MAQPSLSVRIQANLDDLRKSITEGKNIIGEITPAVERMAKTWTTNSQKIVQDAINVTSAMAGMKGGTELTARDASSALKKLEDGMAQLARQGLPIPPLMKQTADQLKATGAGAATATTPTLGLGAAMKSLAASLGLVMSVSALIGFIKGVISAGSEIDDASRKLGVSAEAFQRWKYAATLSGATIDDVSTAVQFMNKTLDGGSASTVNALRRAGLEFETVRAMSPEQAFNTIATAIMQIEDPMTRARVAVELFGRGAATLLPAIASDIVKVGDSAEVMSDRMIRDLDRADDTFVKIGHTIKIWAAGAVINILHPLDALAQWANPLSGVQERMKDLDAQIHKMAAGLPPAIGHFAALSPVTKDWSAALEEATAALAPNEAALKKTWAATDQYRQGIKDLADTYTGKRLAQEVKRVDDAVRAAGGSAQITVFEHAKLAKQLEDLSAQGARLTPALLDIRNAQRSIEIQSRLTTFEVLSAKMGWDKLKLSLPPKELHAVAVALGEFSIETESAAEQLDRLGLSAAPTVKNALPELTSSVDNLAQSFAQLAQISGESFQGIAQGIGVVISAASTAQKSFGQMQDAVKSGFSVASVASFASGVMGIVGVVATSVGGLALVGGAVAGGVAKGKLDESEEHCDEQGFCDPDGLALNGEARDAANASTGLFIAGGVLAVGGVVLWLTSSPATEARNARVSLGASGATLHVRF